MNKQHRVPTAFLREWYRARYRMPTNEELMPLARTPLQHNDGDWMAALLAAAPFLLFVVLVGALGR
jgi:hypothetical protein